MSEWVVRMSNSKGMPYFYNSATKQSVWEAPSGLTKEQVQALPGAQEYLSGSASGGGGAAGQIRASHLLIKHKDSRRPSSWKEAKITRTKEEAIDTLREYQAQIGSSTDTFAELAREHSDCSSHAHDGDLGWFGRGQMQKAFEDVAYVLEVGQISDVISSDSGVHLILRTG